VHRLRIQRIEKPALQLVCASGAKHAARIANHGPSTHDFHAQSLALSDGTLNSGLSRLTRYRSAGYLTRRAQDLYAIGLSQDLHAALARPTLRSRVFHNVPPPPPSTIGRARDQRSRRRRGGDDKAVSRHTARSEERLRSALSIRIRLTFFLARFCWHCALPAPHELRYFGAAEVRLPLSRFMGKPYDIASFAKHLTKFSLCLPATWRVLEEERRPFTSNNTASPKNSLIPSDHQ